MSTSAGSTFTGTAAVARLIGRRDRVRLPVWVVAILGIVMVSAFSVVSLYPTKADAETYARLMEGNPAIVAFSGPGHGFDDPNTGVVFANESSMITALLLALMTVFLVNRHTRTEEEAERIELLRYGQLGRHAPLTASLVAVMGATVALGAALAAGVALAGLPVVGAVAFGAAVAGCGVVFAGITAVSAQVAGTSRGSLGLALGLLGAAFVLRAVGDIGDGTLSWLSPIGWAQAVRPWADERWWVLALMAVVTGALVAAAFALESRRDLGSGLLPQRLGPANARPSTTRPVGLAWRLQRGVLLGFTAAMVPLAVVYGSFAEDVEQMIEDQPELADFLARLEGVSITDSFLATIMLMLALLATGYAVASVLRLRGEETSGRAEPLLATPLSRQRWTASHLTVTTFGTLLLVLVAGAGTGAGLAAVTGELGDVPRLLAAGAVYLPAVLIIAALTLCLYGWAPGAALAGWGLLAAAVLVGMFADLLQLPHWILMLSPFEHVPSMPAQGFAPLPVLVLSALAVGLGAVGIAGVRRRDLA